MKSKSKSETRVAPAPKRKERMAPRKELTPIHVSYISSMTDLSKLTREAVIIEASSTGLLIHVNREDLIASKLRNNLSIDHLVGERVFLRLDDMNLEISGVVARTKFLGKSGFHIAVDYSEEAPDYWRECLMDLLPAPGEFDR